MTYRVRVQTYYTLDSDTADAFAEMCRLAKLAGLPQLYLAQGCYNPGGVAASAGTHDMGGALDISVANLNTAQRYQVETIGRSVGIADWRRYSPPFGGPHIHGIRTDCGDPSRGAAAQVVDYDRGRNGLATHAPDPGSRAYVGVTWANYKAALHAKGQQTASEDEMTPQDWTTMRQLIHDEAEAACRRVRDAVDITVYTDDGHDSGHKTSVYNETGNNPANQSGRLRANTEAAMLTAMAKDCVPVFTAAGKDSGARTSVFNEVGNAPANDSTRLAAWVAGAVQPIVAASQAVTAQQDAAAVTAAVKQSGAHVDATGLAAAIAPVLAQHLRFNVTAAAAA